jgi:hypothetical protein
MPSLPHRIAFWAACAALAACSATGGPFGGLRGAADETVEPDLTGGPGALDADGLAVYLDLMRQLVEGDTVTQAEAFSAAAENAALAPTTTNRLKHALALAVPGHASSDAERAERALSALLAQSDTLLPEERVLATIHLRDDEQRLILDAEAEQLRDTAASELARQNAESSERLEAALEENRRLRAELDEATEALDAITSIERSIRERENGPNAP